MIQRVDRVYHCLDPQVHGRVLEVTSEGPPPRPSGRLAIVASIEPCPLQISERMISRKKLKPSRTGSQVEVGWTIRSLFAIGLPSYTLDTENAGLQTQLMRREAELEELQATLNETVYKVGGLLAGRAISPLKPSQLSKEAERALQLEEEVSARSSELKTERISLRNTELAWQSAQEKLKAEECAKKELESTLDTVSLHSQATSAERQSVQREKRALESRVRELERIVHTHEAKGVSNVPRKNGRPRSSSVSSFRLPAVEQELNDTKAQLHTKDKNLRVLEQKLTQVQDNLVNAENARISIDKASQKRISELLSILERKEEELGSLRETDNTGEREEELLKRIDEDAAKIAVLEKLVTESQATRTSQPRIQKLQSQLKAECEKVHRSEDLKNRLLYEKDELLRQYEASKREIDEGHEVLMARERQIEELEARHG